MAIKSFKDWSFHTVERYEAVKDEELCEWIWKDFQTHCEGKAARSTRTRESAARARAAQPHGSLPARDVPPESGRETIA